MLKSAVVLLSLATMPVLACPKPGDLAGGIQVIETDGVTHRFQQAGAGVVAVDSDYQDGSVGKNQLARGVYVLRLALEDAGVLDITSVFQTDYGTAAGSLPLPKPGLRQSFNTRVTTADEVYDERQDQTWGELKSTTIGGCTYPSLPGRVVYTNDAETFTETILYLPDLGIGLLTSYTYEGEPPDTYSFATISALK